MIITAPDIKKFKRLFFEHFNIELDDDSARFELAGLVRLVELTQNEMKDSNEKQRPTEE